MKILPVDLIVANVMHEAVAQEKLIDRFLEETKKALPTADVATLSMAIEMATARQLLTRIAETAQMKHVYAALAAVGAPSSADLIKDGIQAVKDGLGS